MDVDVAESSGSGEATAVDKIWEHGGRLTYDEVVARAQYECTEAHGTWADYIKGQKGGCTPHANASIVNASAGACDHWNDELGGDPSSYPSWDAVFDCEQMRKFGWVPHVIGVIYTFWVSFISVCVCVCVCVNVVYCCMHDCAHPSTLLPPPCHTHSPPPPPPPSNFRRNLMRYSVCIIWDVLFRSVRRCSIALRNLRTHLVSMKIFSPVRACVARPRYHVRRHPPNRRLQLFATTSLSHRSM